MKKTITTAALAVALSSLASAKSLSDALTHNFISEETGFTTISLSGLKGTTFTSPFVITMTLDAQYIAENIGSTATTSAYLDNLFSVSDSSETTKYLGVAVGNPSNNNDNGFVVMNHLASSEDGLTAAADRYGVNVASKFGGTDLSNTTAAALTFQYNNDTAYFYISITTETDGVSTTTNYVGNRSDFSSLSPSGALGELVINNTIVSSVYVFDTVVVDTTDAYNLNAAALKAVPEPTTATLSLLALAGLAARRRRQ